MEKNVNKRYACLLNGRGSPRYGSLLNHDQPKRPFLSGKLPDEMVGPKPQTTETVF